MNKNASHSRIHRNRENPPNLFTIEVGTQLVYLLKSPVELSTGESVEFVPSIHRLREDLMKEWGLRLPPFLIRENREISPATYRFMLFDKEIVSRSVPPQKTIIISSSDKIKSFAGDVGADPIYSRPCVWVESKETPADSRDSYSASTGEVILDHLESILRANASEFITAKQVREKLDLLNRTEPELVKKTLGKLTFTDLVSLMKNLVPEGIPLTEIEEIMSILASNRVEVEDPDTAAEKLRKLLKNNIHNYVFGSSLPLFVALDSKIQLYLYSKAGKTSRIPENDPVARHIVRELVNLYLYFQGRGFRLGVICCAPVRLILRRTIEKHLPDVIVLKPEEIDPEREIAVIKKIRAHGLGFGFKWLWFMLTMNLEKRKKFNRSMKYLSEFLKKPKDKPMAGIREPGRMLRQPARIYSTPSVSGNLPAPLSITPRQKAAMYLMTADDDFMRSVFKRLNRKEILSIGVEMDNLPRDTAYLGKQLFEDVIRRPGSWSDPSNIASFIQKNLSMEDMAIKLSPLQKIAVILSSLSPKNAEKMYHLILSGIDNRQIEDMTVNASRRQMLSLSEIRRWVVDDFLWFIKENYWPQVLYSPDTWKDQLQRIAVRSPQKCAASIRELWLNQGYTLQRFDKFVRSDPSYAAYWIRRYITSRREPAQTLLLSEKAYILSRLLPGELSREIVHKMGSVWRRVFSMMDSSQPVDPADAGLVAGQFLSHYYTAYESNRFSKTTDN